MSVINLTLSKPYVGMEGKRDWKMNVIFYLGVVKAGIDRTSRKYFLHRFVHQISQTA